MSKPREFWIIDEWDPVLCKRTTLDADPGFLPKTCEVFPVREVVPIDWAKVWLEFSKWNGNEALMSIIKNKIQQLVEKQLAGEE